MSMVRTTPFPLAQTDGQQQELARHVESQYALFESLSLASSALNGRHGHPSTSPSTLLISALEARLEILSSIEQNADAASAAWGFFYSETSFSKLIVGLTTGIQAMIGSAGQSTLEVQVRALMDRVEVLSVGESNVRARAVFERVYGHAEQHVRLIQMLVGTVHLMEVCGAREEIEWCEQDSEEGMLGFLFEGLVV